MKVEEIFVDIQGYEGAYLISNYGRVYSLKTNIFLKKNIFKEK